eukprot:2316117-Amphidinium_carterae.1
MHVKNTARDVKSPSEELLHSTASTPAVSPQNAGKFNATTTLLTLQSQSIGRPFEAYTDSYDDLSQAVCPRARVPARFMG